MRALFDVNVLIALADQNHVGHRSASELMLTNAAAGWASCPLTENGCLRVLTGTRYLNRYRFDQAFAALEMARSRGNHEFGRIISPSSTSLCSTGAICMVINK